MPSYAEINDVKAAMGKLASGLTSTSVPSETDVTNRVLPEISGDIDAVLSARGNSVPITLPTSFVERLKGLNALGASARVVAALFPMAAGPASTTFAQWLQDRYDAGLEMLRNGEGVPEEAAVTGSLPRSLWTSKPIDDEGHDVREPHFKREMVW